MNANASSVRLIIDAAASGPWNMAVDASILQSLKPDDPPTLRFYRWARPTLSLGYFQSLDDRSLHPPSRSIEVVRRATGGGAIVHDRELTYSLAVASSTRRTGASAWLYETVHQCVIDALDPLGIVAARHGLGPSITNVPEPFLCFQRRTTADLVVGGYKILGSAQRRGAYGLLQHGSLLLAASPFAPELPGVIELGGRWDARLRGKSRISAGDFAVNDPGGEPAAWDLLGTYLIQAIVKRLARQMNSTPQRGALTAAEESLAVQLESDRFSRLDWTAKR
ncbi:MAG: lipoate--protein ligase family protein [Planctomycetaceae bacterium]